MRRNCGSWHWVLKMLRVPLSWASRFTGSPCFALKVIAFDCLRCLHKTVPHGFFFFHPFKCLELMPAGGRKIPTRWKALWQGLGKIAQEFSSSGFLSRFQKYKPYLLCFSLPPTLTTTFFMWFQLSLLLKHHAVRPLWTDCTQLPCAQRAQKGREMFLKCRFS